MPSSGLDAVPVRARVPVGPRHGAGRVSTGFTGALKSMPACVGRSFRATCHLVVRRRFLQASSSRSNPSASSWGTHHCEKLVAVGSQRLPSFPDFSEAGNLRIAVLTLSPSQADAIALPRSSGSCPSEDARHALKAAPFSGSPSRVRAECETSASTMVHDGSLIATPDSTGTRASGAGAMDAGPRRAPLRLRCGGRIGGSDGGVDLTDLHRRTSRGGDW